MKNIWRTWPYARPAIAIKTRRHKPLLSTSVRGGTSAPPASLPNMGACTGKTVALGNGRIPQTNLNRILAGAGREVRGQRDYSQAARRTCSQLAAGRPGGSGLSVSCTPYGEWHKGARATASLTHTSLPLTPPPPFISHKWNVVDMTGQRRRKRNLAQLARLERRRSCACHL